MTYIAGSEERIGDAAVADCAVAINQQINAIVPDEPTDCSFLWALVRNLKPTIQAKAEGVMTRIVNKKAREYCCYPTTIWIGKRNLLKRCGRARERASIVTRAAHNCRKVPMILASRYLKRQVFR